MLAGELRIGITIGLSSEAETVWNNGIKQNAIYLAEALRACPCVASVCLVNTTAVVLVPSAIPWDVERWPTRAFEEIKDGLDVLIELGGQISPQATDYLKERGTRLVSYCCGSEYIHAMEAILFSRPAWGERLFVNQRYDAIWMVPQVERTSRHYFETLRRREARVVPFVWSPVLLEQRCAELAKRVDYAPRTGPRRLVVMEPNHDVVKFCLYPILIAEEAYRRRPHDVQMLYVTNAQELATNNSEFISLMHQLDLVRDHKAVFLGRYDTPQFLSEMADVVISHQWDNPLNYFYFDVCWLGYPMIHNAHMCRDLGYFYEDNNVRSGAFALLHAISRHDTYWEAYRRRQRVFLDNYSPVNEEVTESYHQLLLDLMHSPIA